MIDLAERLGVLGFAPLQDFRLRDDGDGPFIAAWLADVPQPSAVAIEAVGPVFPPKRVYRVQFVERLTPEEATTLEAALDAAEPKLRLMYQSVDYFLSDDPLFAVLHWTVATALGSEGAPNFARADDLLAGD